MTTFVKKYVLDCNICQQTKPAQYPITRLPCIGGYDAIIIYIDYYSKQVHILLTTFDINVEGIADLHYQEIF